MSIYEPTDSTNAALQATSSGVTIGKSNGIHLTIASGEVAFFSDATTKIFGLALRSTGTSYYGAIRRETTSGHGEVGISTENADLEATKTYNGETKSANVWAQAENTESEAGLNAIIPGGNYAEIRVDVDNADSVAEISADHIIIHTDEFNVNDQYITHTGAATFGALNNGVFTVTTEEVFASSSISSGSHKYSTVTINDASHAKYYPLGIVGWNSPDTSQFVPSRLRLSSASTGSATIAYDVRNTGSSAATGKFNADVLWLKVTA